MLCHLNTCFVKRDLIATKPVCADRIATCNTHYKIFALNKFNVIGLALQRNMCYARTLLTQRSIKMLQCIIGKVPPG
jgi:hypothetical protein